MKEPGELWFQLKGDTSDRCCEMSMADFCALVHIGHTVMYYALAVAITFAALLVRNALK